METEVVLWAVKIGAKDWQEDLITSGGPAKIAAARAWAEANGFDRLRESVFVPGERPDFVGALRKP